MNYARPDMLIHGMPKVVEMARFLAVGLFVLVWVGGVRGAPRIVEEPQSVAVRTGMAAQLMVRAEGAGTLQYQWRRYGLPVAGGNSATLTLPAAKQADGGFFDVMVRDDSGQSVVSASARVMVQPVAGKQYRMDVSFAPFIETAGATLTAVRASPSGGVYVAGSFSTIANERRFALARFDGTLALDPSFAPVINGNVNALAVQADGRVLIGGSFTRVNGIEANRIARLNPDGSLDTSLQIGSGFSGTVDRLLLTPSGKILVSGSGGYYNGQLVATAVLGSSGELLQSVPIGLAEALAVQPDGQILVAGRSALWRVRTDGTVDTTFPTLEVSGLIRSLAVQPDGKVVVGGTVTTYGGTAVGRLFRLKPDGSLDPSFAIGSGCDAEVTTVTSLEDGRIVVGGWFSQCGGLARPGIAVLASSGACETGFVPNAGPLMVVRSVAVLDGGKLVLAGIDYGQCSGLAAFDSQGSLVATAAPGLRMRSPVTKIARVLPQADGKWLVNGNFSHVDGEPRTNLARLNGDGSLDRTFDAGSVVSEPIVEMLQQDDGKNLLAFFRTESGGETLIRLNTDGTKDTTFSVGDGFNLIPYALALLPDGTIAVGGGTIGGSPGAKVRVLSRTGSTVSSFDGSDFLYADVRALLVRANGDLLIGGSFFSDANGVFQVLQVARDGTPHGRFSLGSDYSQKVGVLAEDREGRVVVAGRFNGSFESRYFQNICRLRPDLTLDPDFEIGMKAEVSSIVTLATGEILTNQQWTKGSEAAPRFVAGLSATGAPDAGFDAVDLWNNPVSRFSVTDNGRVLVVGPDGERGLAISRQFAILKADSSPLPVIVASTGDLQRTKGETAAFSIVATGEAPLTYRWRRGLGGEGAWMEDATSSELVLPSLDLTQSGDYTVRVANDFGFAEATMHLTVVPKFAIVEQPNDTYSNGANTWISVAAEGAGTLRYQWYHGEAGDTSRPIDGATGDHCTVGDVSTWEPYWVRIWQGTEHLDSRTAVVIAQYGPVRFSEWTLQGLTPGHLRGPLDTPAGDGTSNLLKFALGVPPMSPVPANRLPAPWVMDGEGSERFLALTCVINSQAQGIELGLEVSDDLDTWVAVPFVRTLVMPYGGTLQLISLREVPPLGNKSHRFVRLVVRLQ